MHPYATLTVQREALRICMRDCRPARSTMNPYASLTVRQEVLRIFMRYCPSGEKRYESLCDPHCPVGSAAHLYARLPVRREAL